MDPRVTAALTLLMLLSSAVERPTGGALSQKAIVPTFTVDDPGDNLDLNPGDGACQVAFTFKCSLRAAIQESNVLAGVQVIALPPGTYTLTRAGAGEDLAATGDLDLLDDVIIVGAGWGKTIISAGFIDRVFHVFNGASAEILDLQVRYGDVTVGGGGGIRVALGAEVALTGVSIYGNLANEGAGLSNKGTASLTSSEVAFNYTVGSSTPGGGLLNEGGSLSVIRSSIHDNGATGVGGGIYTDGLFVGLTTTTVEGSTITGNTPDGIYSQDTSLTVSGSTIANNGDNGLKHQVLFNGSMTLSCSIVSGHSDQDCFFGGGSFTSGGYNLSQDGTCSGDPSDRTADPKLGPLSSGSFPAGRAPLVGSPAIDGGSNGLCPSPDQWGRSRPLDLDRDGVAISNVGALEDAMIFGDGFESGDTTAW